MSLQARLAALIDERYGGNWAELGRRAQIPSSNLQKIKSGSDPRASTLAAIARALDVSLDWLVLGVGPTPLQREGPAPRGNAPVDDVYRQEEVHLLGELGLGAIASLARRGANAGAWRLYRVLAASQPASVSSQELVARLNLQPTDLAADLALLVAHGLVERAPGSDEAWRARATVGRVLSDDPADVSQHGLEAIRKLALLLNQRDSGRNKLVTAFRDVPVGAGAQLVEEVLAAVRQRWVATGPPGNGEEVTLVLGLAVGTRQD